MLDFVVKATRHLNDSQCSSVLHPSQPYLCWNQEIALLQGELIGLVKNSVFITKKQKKLLSSLINNSVQLSIDWIRCCGSWEEVCLQHLVNRGAGSLPFYSTRICLAAAPHSSVLQFHHKELFQLSSNHLFACQCEPLFGGSIRVPAAM